MEPVWGISVGGEWVRASRGATIPVVDPSTGQSFATVPKGAAADARAAAHAARWAFDDGPWPGMTPAERATILKRFAVEATIDRSVFVECAIRESGVPVRYAETHAVGPALDALAWYARRAVRDPETRLPDHPGPPPTSSTVVREPVGVVAVLAAAAEPLACLAHKMMPALVAGNTVVVKASSQAPLAAYALARCAARAGFPPGVVNVVSGPGRELATELAGNHMVDVVALAGRIATGRRIAPLAAAHLASCVFTLGASGWVLALDDAPVEELVSWLATAWLWNAGQAWGAPCRLVATPGVHDQLVEAVAHEAKGQRLGDPSDPATQVGPMRSAKARDRAQALIAAAVAAGATPAAGGGRPEQPAAGAYLEPAVLTGVAPDSPAVSDEIAAPILAVVAAHDDDDAIRIVNEGLNGVVTSVWASSRERALDAARQVRAGTVQAQGAGTNPSAPFGGYGRAGLGREGGSAGIDAYCEIKHVAGPA